MVGDDEKKMTGGDWEESYICEKAEQESEYQVKPCQGRYARTGVLSPLSIREAKASGV